MTGHGARPAPFYSGLGIACMGELCPAHHGWARALVKAAMVVSSVRFVKNDIKEKKFLQVDGIQAGTTNDNA
jgi:hypothetical protein